MTPQESGTSVDYLAALGRRRWSVIVPTVLGLAAGVALAVLLPREYVTSATIAVTSPSVSRGLAPSTQADQVERVRAIQQELLSTPVVEEVARVERLLDGATVEEVVADIRRRTTISLPATKPLSAPGRFEPDTFVVSSTAPTPELAQRITNRLARVFVDSHSKIREARAEGTSAFLERQVTRSRQKVAAAETRLREAKASYQGRLPEQTVANLQTVTALRQQVDSDAMALRAERERLRLIDRQLEEMKQDQQRAAVEAVEARSRERLAGLERQLAAAEEQYTPRHPELQRLEAELARARAADAEERSRAAPVETTGADPVLRQLLADREQARLRVRDLEAAGARTEASLATYEELLSDAPLVEQRLMSLSQAYEFEKQQHDKLAEQYQAALLNEDLERGQAGERFVVLYPAERPERPSSPNVLLVLGASLVGGLVLGGALAMAREFLDHTVHDRRTLEREFGRPVLAEISRF